MADPATIRATVERYIAAFSANDREGWLDCFAPDGTLEDPVGTEVRTGRRSIGEFFDGAQASADSITMELTGPIRVAGGEAAFPFRISPTIGGALMSMPVIDVMTFDDDGRITSMRAYWDLEDMAPAES